MSRPSIRILFMTASLVGLGAVITPPASAQSMSPWGVWGGRDREAPRGYRQAPRREMRYEDPWFDDWDTDGTYSAQRRRAQKPALSDRIASGGAKPSITPRRPRQVAFNGGSTYAVGSIVIDVKARKLYNVRGGNVADVYNIGVGRDGFRWTGVEKVSRVAQWPDWHPPAEMRKREPHLPVKMTGGIKNPLGARAIYLGSTLYRIHGTNNPKSIGTAQSSGCFRMMNEDVAYLAQQVAIGADVHVVKSLGADAIAGLPRTRPAQSQPTRTVVADEGDEGVDVVSEPGPNQNAYVSPEPVGPDRVNGANAQPRRDASTRTNARARNRNARYEDDWETETERARARRWADDDDGDDDRYADDPWFDEPDDYDERADALYFDAPPSRRRF